jgi:hypothetical protein
MPVIIGDNTINVGGKLLETSKFSISSLPSSVPAVTPVDVATGYKYMSLTYGYQSLVRDATNLVAWYKMEDNLDSSGNGFNLTLQGAAAISTTNDGILANKYLILNGANNYADIPSTFNLYNVYNSGTTIGGSVVGITFSIWFKAASGSTTTARFFEFANNASGTNPTIFITIYKNGTNITFRIDTPTINAYNTSGGINFYDNTWKHICWAIDSNGVWSIYINGAIITGVNKTVGIPNLTYTRQYIGRSAFATDGWNTGGAVEDFRIYNVALTAAEVLALYNNGTRTSYSVSFPDPSGTLCDILIVGGGGAGGNSIGGGGGAGGVVYTVNQTLTGNYIINVGKGGIGRPLLTDGQGQVSDDGKESAILNTVGSYISMNMGGTSRELRGFGGGGGGVYFDSATLVGRPGGSGGGSGESEHSVYSGGSSIQPATLWNGTAYVAGGSAGHGNLTSDGNYYGAGGGGAGATLFNNIYNGKTGVSLSITGTPLFYAAGAGGGQLNPTDNATLIARGLGASGIGGTGRVFFNSAYVREATSGQNNTGSGGGGGAYITDPDLPAGNGGSGIVIIRYQIPTKLTLDSQWTYSALNTNVYYPVGNVGIGTTNPTNSLHVVGDTFSTTYSGGSKNFKIEHPLKINKWLYHGCIEGPRFDNIYRGKKTIIEGKAEVDIDKECNTTGGMTPGTFPALNTNYQLYLQNNKTFDRVKGTIDGSKIQIESQNVIDEIEVDWLVVGERQDQTVINPEFTDSDGNLICEHDILEERVGNIDLTEEYTTNGNNNDANIIIEDDANNVE